MKKVLVKWYDTEATTGWKHKRAVDELLDMGLDVAKTVGYLLRKDKKIVAICQSRHIDNRAEILVIPRACIISIKKLQE